MIHSILCVDPGKTTGIVELTVPSSGPAIIEKWVEIPGAPHTILPQFTDWYRKCNLAENQFDMKIVIETWDYRHNQPTDARMACEPIGMVKMLAYLRNIWVVEQRPAYRVSIPDTKKQLAPLGYWIGAEGHARQALRHGLAYLTHTTRHMPTLEHLHPR